MYLRSVNEVRVYETGRHRFYYRVDRIIREVEIVRNTGGFYLIRFKDSGGGIKVRENRLFPTREEAEENLPQSLQKQHRTPYDYM